MSRTAYEEALASGDLSKLPSYITASDTLSGANKNQSFLDSALETVESIPKFIGVSVISGANQLYNIPADLGNLIFDAGIETSKTEDVITGLDSDLGQFYTEHKQGADLVGFMVSSAIPGLGGVKILNAGQASLRTAITAGKFSPTMGKALGLLAPAKKLHLDRAIKEAMTGTSVASLTQGNALRAITAGFGQSALEALAFETATAATLFNSPILENQDFGDFVTNVAWGAGVFGLVGGAIDATKIRFSLKNVVDEAATAARPWTSISEPAAASSIYERIAIRLEDIKSVPDNIPAGLDPARATFLEQAGKTKVNKLNTLIRKDLAEITGGDQQLADTLFQTFKNSPVEEAQSAFIGLQRATPLKVHATGVGKRAEILTSKVASGKATVAEMDEFLETKLKTAYAKAWGEGAGKVTAAADGEPIITQLVDTLGKNQRIHVSKGISKTGAGKVTAGKHEFKFNTYENVGKKPKLARPITHSTVKAGVLETNARYIWADRLEQFTPSASKPYKVDVNDLPLLEKMYLDTIDNADALAHVEFTGLRADEFVGENLFEFVAAKKIEVANKLLGRKTNPVVQDEIAAMVNVKSSLLSGAVKESPVNTFHADDIFAMQDHTARYTQKLVDQGSRHKSEGLVDLWTQPQHIKMTYDTTPFNDVNNFVLENMVTIKAQQKLYQEGTARASAQTGSLREFYDQLPEINSGRVYTQAVPSGGEAGVVTSAGGNYGSLAAAVTQAGNVTSRAIAAAKTTTREALEPLLYKLGTKKAAAVEWSTLNARVRGIEGQYGLNEAGTALEPLQLIRWRKAAAEATETGAKAPRAPTLTAGQRTEPVIEILHQETRDLLRAHIEINGSRTNDLAALRTAQGAQFNRSPDVFYPIPVNPKDFPHFALVTDSSITSGNHSKTLFATSADELNTMVRKLKQNPQLTVRTKQEADDYFKSIGQWDYEKTLSDNYLDNAAHRVGVSEPFIVSTDPQKITSEMLDWHMQRETGLVREAVTSNYEVQFRELQRLGDEATNIASSRFGAAPIEEFAESAVKNPFAGYVRTALAIKNKADYPWWTIPNQMADVAFSRMFRKIGNAFNTLKPGDDVTEINKLLKQSGYKGAQYDAEMDIFANVRPAKGLLTETVQKANSLLATTILRWDPLNAANNAISANVLLGAETNAVIRAISRGDKGAVGALADVAKIKVPGTGELILAPEKLIARAISKFGTKTKDFKFYEDNGFITSLSRQYSDTLEDLTFAGNLDSWAAKVKSRHAKMKEIGNIGEVATGNKLAEEFNRFVAADVMKQLTDVGVKRGLISAKEQLAYINTFVNRTQGNYLAAQRPMLFQGPLGQAIGLFQTYQFNLMQQLLRHVGEGHAKDSMTLLALQGTIHGMNGMPAFNAINTHIVGNASGNQEHKDAYTALYGTVGKEAGDWLMYGMASNTLGLIDPALKVNLYTRGDINPRHVTIIPTNPADVPAYAAATKFFGNLFGTVKTLAAGGDISNTILQGIEHNGLSRPLAGLAQTIQGLDNPSQASYSTTNKGNVIAANDLLSLTNITRMAGGKPLDEAVAIDAVYRYKAYALKDAAKRTQLGKAIKTHMITGQDPTQEQIEDFAVDYAKYGGRSEEFNSFMSQLYKTTNLSQANKLRDNLSGPFSQSMQEIMGGQRLRDFTAEQ